jgi:hypothetical protein
LSILTPILDVILDPSIVTVEDNVDNNSPSPGAVQWPVISSGESPVALQPQSLPGTSQTDLTQLTVGIE